MAEKKMQIIKNSASKIAERADSIGSVVAGKTIDAAHFAGDKLEIAKNDVIEKLDLNGDGQIGIDDIINLAVKTPGVHISRDKFLRKELYKNHPKEVIEAAIATTPAKAGISSEEIDKLADDVIAFERTYVSGISAALGAPGGAAMIATIPADIGQYYGYTLRAVQKLLYLYGFPEIDSDEEGIQLDDETLNTIIICLGVMNGVAGANNAIKAMAKALAVGVEKQLMKQALTKGAVYPIVKSVMKWFGVKLTKSVFTGAIGKAIPFVGSVIGGGITYATFKPCCYRLKDALLDTMLSNPSHKSTKEEDEYVDDIIKGTIVDVECTSESE